MKIPFKQFALGIAGACILTIYGCGGGDASTTDLNSVTNSVSTPSCSGSQFGSSSWYDAKRKAYAGDTQCLTQIQAAESYRTAAIANCAAGSTSGATGNMSYYNTSVKYVNSICP